MTIKPIVAAALALSSAVVAPAAQAQRYDGDGYGAPRYEQRYAQRYDQPYRGPAYQRDNYDRGYDQRGYDQRNYDGRSYRPCRNGATGAILGAVVGGLFGRAIDGRGDHATGTILGAAGGALAGRAVERSNNQGYCRAEPVVA